jgi:hypothetical protein
VEWLCSLPGPQSPWLHNVGGMRATLRLLQGDILGLRLCSWGAAVRWQSLPRQQVTQNSPTGSHQARVTNDLPRKLELDPPPAGFLPPEQTCSSVVDGDPGHQQEATNRDDIASAQARPTAGGDRKNLVKTRAEPWLLNTGVTSVSSHGGLLAAAGLVISGCWRRADRVPTSCC